MQLLWEFILYFLTMCSRITMLRIPTVPRIPKYKFTAWKIWSWYCNSITRHIQPMTYGTITFLKLVNPDFWAAGIWIIWCCRVRFMVAIMPSMMRGRIYWSMVFSINKCCTYFEPTSKLRRICRKNRCKKARCLWSNRRFLRSERCY
jgi:hypothetical protein